MGYRSRFDVFTMRPIPLQREAVSAIRMKRFAAVICGGRERMPS
jgi:hypothetical protein